MLLLKDRWPFELQPATFQCSARYNKTMTSIPEPKSSFAISPRVYTATTNVQNNRYCHTITPIHQKTDNAIRTIVGSIVRNIHPTRLELLS